MSTYTFKKLSAVAAQSDFTSTESQHIIVEDGGNIRRIPKNALNNPITTALSEKSTDTEVPSAKAVYDALSNTSPVVKAKEYGVRKLIDSVLPDLERVGDAVGLVAHVCQNGEEVYNDFDNIYPWSHMKRCNLSDSGEVVAYKGDLNYSTNGYTWIRDAVYSVSGTELSASSSHPMMDQLAPSYGAHCYAANAMLSYTAIPAQVMVEIPKFYQKYETPGDGYEYWWVSDTCEAGYRCSPVFDNKDKIYISAYSMSVVEESGIAKAASISGVFPSTNQTRAAYRDFARARGLGWELPNLAHVSDIIQHLMIVEFATFNLSSLMLGHSMHFQGYKLQPCGRVYGTIGEETNSAKIIIDYNNIRNYFSYFVPDETCVIFASDDASVFSEPRLIKSIVDIAEDESNPPTISINNNEYPVNLAEITFDGDPIVLTNDASNTEFCRILGCPAKSGTTDSMQASSGQMLHNTSMCWRGLEDVYGNCWQHIDGTHVFNNDVYLTIDPAKYVDVTAQDIDEDGNFPKEAYDVRPSQEIDGYSMVTASAAVPKTLGYISSVPWARLPTGAGAYDSGTGLTDYTFNQVDSIATPYMLLTGGGFTNHYNIGVFSYSTGTQNIAYAARLVY